ncbi:MAG: amidohydrolase family protein [Candidatus Latescibacterota bacterium]
MKDYFDRVHEGLPIGDVEIIDFHAHIGPYFNMHIAKSSPDEMVWMMDRCGISKTVSSATPALCGDLVQGNDLMLEAVRAHRGRIYGACATNGHYPELSLNDLHRTFEDPGVVCVKIHPFLSCIKMNDKRMKGIYEFTAARRLFMIVHTWLDADPYGNLDLFASVAKDWPDINWLMGHSGGPFGAHRAVEIVRELPNVFIDLTISSCPARQFEFFVKEVGSDRMILGTDNPFIDPRPQIGRVFLADISKEDMVNIVGGNVKRYIKFV